MKQLLLLRHGEAGFSQGLDFERKLTPKGKEKLIRMGENLDQKLKSVDLVYCSAAVRTMETAELMEKHMSIKERVFTNDIYQGNLGDLLGLLEKTPSSVDSCLLIGHNPTISLLLAHLSDENYLGFQPGMLAVVELEISDWGMVGFGTGRLKEVFQ